VTPAIRFGLASSSSPSSRRRDASIPRGKRQSQSRPQVGDRPAASTSRNAPRAAGLDPREFAGHSLRSGYATQAARYGHHPTQIAATTRHQDQRVLAGYIRAARGREDIAHVL
jgi:hypothetical protein